MSDTCDNNCSGCAADCSDRKEEFDFIAKPHELSKVKRVIGVVSGKGGVGKSMVTSLLAVTMQRLGYKTAVLDADITGPSIPKAFGLKEKAQSSEMGLFPVRTKTGLQVMSVNLLLENDTDPVVWRGPIIANMVKQFWSDVIWGDIDYMFVDMPPGTGDVALTVFQSIPLDGVIIVTLPQDLVSLIVKKAYNMAKSMNKPVLGIVENMSWIKCPDCGKEIELFGKSKLDEVAEELGVPILGRMPIDPSVAELCDGGEIEKVDHDYLNKAVEYIENLSRD